MPKTVQKEKVISYVFSFLLVLILLILSANNLNKYFSNEKVLGIKVINQTEEQDEETKKYWEDLLAKNPDYIPGWIELGNFERVKTIDPNYFLLP